MSEEKVAGAAGSPSGGGTPAGNQEIPGFKVIRSAPPPSAQSSVPWGPILILLVLAAGGVIFALNSGEDGDGAGGDGGSPTPTATPEDVAVPGFVWDRFYFLEEEGRLDSAIEYGREMLSDYPNQELRTEIARLNRELGGSDPVQATIGEAQDLIAQGNHNEALAKLERYSDGDDAELHFLRVCLIEAGTPTDARDALEEARALGDAEDAIERQLALLGE